MLTCPRRTSWGQYRRSGLLVDQLRIAILPTGLATFLLHSIRSINLPSTVPITVARPSNWPASALATMPWVESKLSRSMLWRRLLRALSVALLASATPVLAQKLTCTTAAKFDCDAQRGCRKRVARETWAVVDLTKRTYLRCDNRGCEAYSAAIVQSGDFIVVDMPGHGVTAKVSSDFDVFLEVATIGTDAMISFGRCQSD